MALISISEFQSATGLSDAAMYRLIKASPAWLSLDPRHGLLVESSSVDVQTIIKAVTDVRLESDESLISAVEQRILEFLQQLMAERTKDGIENGEKGAARKKGKNDSNLHKNRR